MGIRNSRIERGKGISYPRKIVENFETGFPQMAESFVGHADGALLEVDASWFSIPGEATNVNCYGRAHLGDNMVARFYDHDAANYIHKLYVFPYTSQGINIVGIEMDINLVQAANRTFYVTFLDGGTGNILQIFLIGPAGLYMIEFPNVPRQLYTVTGGGGVAMTSTGNHHYQFLFDEINNEFRIFQEGVEYFADDGAGGTFAAYYQAGANNIDSIYFSSGTPAGGGGAESSDLECFVDNIEASWLPVITDSPLWTALPGDDGNVGDPTRLVVTHGDRRCFLLHDQNGIRNLEVGYNFNGYISHGKICFDVYPVTSGDANDLLLFYLYEGVTQLFCIGISPQNQNVYVWVGAVQTDTTLNVNLDVWNTIEIIFRPNTYIVKVNGAPTIQYNLVNNVVLGGDNIQIMTVTAGTDHNVFIDNIGVSWL